MRFMDCSARDRKGLEPTTSKQELVKAYVSVRQSWVETTGASAIFKSAKVPLNHEDILMIPVTHWDISDPEFVEIVFWPSALKDQLVKSVKAFIPKGAITLIVELPPDSASALGFGK